MILMLEIKNLRCSFFPNSSSNIGFFFIYDSFTPLRNSADSQKFARINLGIKLISDSVIGKT